MFTEQRDQMLFTIIDKSHQTDDTLKEQLQGRVCLSGHGVCTCWAGPRQTSQAWTVQVALFGWVAPELVQS